MRNHFLCFLLPFFFFKVQSKIGVRIIHGCALYTGKYGTFNTHFENCSTAVTKIIQPRKIYNFTFNWKSNISPVENSLNFAFEWLTLKYKKIFGEPKGKGKFNALKVRNLSHFSAILQGIHNESGTKAMRRILLCQTDILYTLNTLAIV